MRILVFILLFSSCQIKGNLKGLYSYKNEISGMKSVVLSDVYSCDIEYSKTSKVSVINGLQLKNCMQFNENALIYIWQPNCSSKKCIDLNVLQKDCAAKNLDLYVVAEYYDRSKMEINYELKNPIIGIDTDYYNSNLTSKYLKKFLEDIGMTSVDNLKSKYFHYHKGLFSVWNEYD